MSKKLTLAMEDTLSSRLTQIRQMPMHEIKQLPEYSDEEIHVFGKVFTLATWKKERPGSIFFIVVQHIIAACLE